MFIKCLSILNIYFFLNGLFKRVEFNKEVTVREDAESEYDSVIYILLDALRYDYILNYSKILNDKSTHYLHNTMINYNKIPYKFQALSVCGIPTSTTCRVTGLLTGAPSNFLEGTKTFLNISLNIDNMVYQLNTKYNGSVSFFGDNTWRNLCPVLNECTTFTMDPYSKKDLQCGA